MLPVLFLRVSLKNIVLNFYKEHGHTKTDAKRKKQNNPGSRRRLAGVDGLSFHYRIIAAGIIPYINASHR
jgi:hypothetical protein